ncbi:MAG: heme-binding protein [Geminicoccaceae bacterium]
MMKLNLTKLCSVAAIGALAILGGAAQAWADCPVSYNNLKDALKNAVAADKTDFNNPMWAVVVDRSGAVCQVAFSGSSRTSQWLLSRQIAAAKAFTANGLAIKQDGKLELFDTKDLDPLVQPGKPLYGVALGNPGDPDELYKGPFDKWGTANDPLIGKRVGGTITFGGGVALVKGKSEIVGGLGISGDSVVRDHSVAVKTRDNLNLAP